MALTPEQIANAQRKTATLFEQEVERSVQGHLANNGYVSKESAPWALFGVLDALPIEAYPFLALLADLCLNGKQKEAKALAQSTLPVFCTYCESSENLGMSEYFEVCCKTCLAP